MPGKGFIFALTTALGCLLFLSFATSGYGLWEMLSSQHGGGDDFLGTFWGGLVLIAAATMVSGIIQVLIGGFWNSAAVPTLGLGVRAVCGTVGAFTSLVSAGLATAFYTLVLPVADDIVVFRNDQAFADIAGPLVAFSGDMQQIGVGMEALAAAMVASQALERRGESCDGPPVAPGEGPRWRMRVRLTGEASELSIKATALANDALETATLPASVDDAVMQSAFSRARSLSIDPRLRELKSWVQGTLDDFQNGFTDQAAGTFVCRDRSVEEELSTFLNLLEEPISLPAVPPRAETFDFADSLENSYSGIFGSLAALVGVEGVRNDDEFEKTKPALMIALAVEAFIIVLTFLRVWLTQPKKPAGSRRKRYGKAAPKPRGNRLKPEIALAYSADVELFSRLIEPIGPGQRMFFVPKNGDEEVAHRARSLADEWSMQIMPGGSSMDVSLHAPSRQEGLSDATGGATVFDVYEVPYQALKWLQQTSRDLAETRLHEEGLTP